MFGRRDILVRDSELVEVRSSIIQQRRKDTQGGTKAKANKAGNRELVSV